MSAFSVEIDPRRKLMQLVIRGYWDQATFDAYAAAFEQALTRMQATGGIEYTVVDGREFAVQARDISEQFGELIARNLHRVAPRVATVVAAQLNRLQAERTGGELHARYFTDMDEALAWLFEPESRAA